MVSRKNSVLVLFPPLAGVDSARVALVHTRQLGEVTKSSVIDPTFDPYQGIELNHNKVDLAITCGRANLSRPVGFA